MYKGCHPLIHETSYSPSPKASFNADKVVGVLTNERVSKIYFSHS